ncbi:MAG: 2-isopropylmalate synthase [Polyangiaceae bacterium UTPRO1]|jgi:2-isopropylmalate synthase|nr:2-isopropylmalate synthase [Myxococcales bacterium]OQY68684.1 MAG: 2-isopropylmalate synthase [Polyangiaceae bacterium UTPRO1]
MQANDPNYVQIFDTTLRDGEQSPGASMNVEEKIAIARQLEQLNVDVIEAGFAASSEGDFVSVRRVSEAVATPIVLSLARTKEADIERAIRAVERAKRPGIHIFIATSDIHLQHKLMMSRQEVIDAAAWAVGLAGKHLDYIEFSAEDASRSDPEYLVSVFAEVIRAGAVTLNVPDTTGYALPHQTSALFRYLIGATPGGHGVRWSAHCHNDLGMAVANSLAAVEAGARQVECTVNGLGERAGNAAMDEIVMALRTRRDFFGLETGIVTEQIYAASRLVSQITGIPIPINKPIVGENAFAHEAGIHQDGVLKNKITYEIMRPETVGVGSNRLVLGKHSGRHAFVDRLKELGIAAQGIDMNKAFARFKTLADKKKSVYDEDLMAIVAEEAVRVPDRFELTALSVTSSTDVQPSASLRLRIDGVERAAQATGDGIVDACYHAIAAATGTRCKLERYAVKAITSGTDAQGEVSCLVRDGSLTSTGQGAHTDIIVASALAFLNALNKLEYRRRYEDRARVTGP